MGVGRSRIALPEPLDWVEQAARTGRELRQSIREAHELLRDLKSVRRELIELRSDIVQGIPELVHKAFDEAVADILTEYKVWLEDLTVESINRISTQTLAAVSRTMEDMDKLAAESFAAIVKDRDVLESYLKKGSK